jgi:hypothetical protein
MSINHIISNLEVEYKVEEFKKSLAHLINQHNIENIVDMPDFILADMICNMILSMGPSIKQTLDWHGCNSICHTITNGAINDNNR